MSGRTKTVLTLALGISTALSGATSAIAADQEPMPFELYLAQACERSEQLGLIVW